MQEFLNNVASSLRAAGFEVSVGPMTLNVAGCSLSVWWRRSRSRACYLQNSRFTKSQVAPAVLHVIERLPHLLKQKQQQEDYAGRREMCVDMLKTLADKRFSLIATNDGGYVLSFKTNDWTIVTCACDMLKELSDELGQSLEAETA